jgi:hypothetical protein
MGRQLYGFLTKTHQLLTATTLEKCVPNKIAHFSKDIKHFMAVYGESLKIFLLFYKSSCLVASSSPYNWL